MLQVEERVCVESGVEERLAAGGSGGQPCATRQGGVRKAAGDQTTGGLGHHAAGMHGKG